MKKAVKYASLIASAAGIAAVTAMGLKIAANDYEIIAECLIVGICLIVLFACAVYTIAKKDE
jgi:hypothetical protein